MKGLIAAALLAIATIWVVPAAASADPDWRPFNSNARFESVKPELQQAFNRWNLNPGIGDLSRARTFGIVHRNYMGLTRTRTEAVPELSGTHATGALALALGGMAIATGRRRAR